MEHDFIVNEEQIEELKKKLGEANEALESQVIHIYTQIKTLGHYWNGDSYNVFSKKCEEFHPTLDALVALVGGFKTMIENDITSPGIDHDLIENIAKALNMEF